ncbi:hypothetical protein [Roseovarius sp. ZX-A-9]|uniref:hypothetical protein n=1 Tax=Roseovarius sp. ZX-A-9 TaxID=3014783 RepID=UPI0023302057|nr:hypothetical protein [Roseovarius sp. ZX-A-9]
MALAFENLYVGLLDGQWGAGSRKALTRYSYERFDTAPINDHLAELSLGMSKRIAFSGWDMDYLKTYGMSLLFPHIAYYEEPDSGSFENWHHTRSSLAIAASRTDLAGVKSHHAFGLDQPADDTPYTVRRDGTWITSTRGNNRLLYIRSDYVDSGWTTIILSAAQTDQGLLNAVAASLAPGRRAPIEHSKDGMLDRIVNLHLGIGD